jgi:hypothetical protein
MKKTKKLRFFLIALLITACEDSPFFVNNDLVSAIEGTWNCSEDSSLNGSQAYTVDISRYAYQSDSIVLDNFYNIGSGKEVIAVVSGQDITIHEQLVDGFTFQGTGHIQSNAVSISLSYTADLGGEIDHVTCILVQR